MSVTLDRVWYAWFGVRCRLGYAAWWLVGDRDGYRSYRRHLLELRGEKTGNWP